MPLGEPFVQAEVPLAVKMSLKARAGTSDKEGKIVSIGYPVNLTIFFNAAIMVKPLPVIAAVY